MADFIAFTIIGLSLGSIYAISASGLVMTYSTTAIFNFSHGAIAMFAAFLYWQFRVQWHLPALVAIFIVLGVICPIIGILLHRLIFQHLKNTLLSTKIVIPIALMLLMIGAANWIWSDTVALLSPFWGPTSKVEIPLGGSSAFVTTHQIFVLVLSAFLALGLYFLLSRTRLGISMRGVVDDPELSQMNGVSPGKISTSSWIIGVTLAGLAGILIATLQNRSLDKIFLTLLLVNAFAAGIFGRLRSVPATFLGALVIGLAVSYWNWVISTVGTNWNWLAGFRVSIPVIILFIVLIVLPHERLRETVVARTKEQFSIPSLRKAGVWVGVAVIAAFLIVPIIEASAVLTLSRGVALGIIALSLVALTGYTGQINLAPMAFAGIGAMIAFQVDIGPNGSPIRESMSLWAIVLATIVCGLVGALVALPALRLKGIYLALSTFAFAIIVSNMIFNQRSPLNLNIPWVGDGEDLTINLFSNGGLNTRRPNWFGINFNDSHYSYFVFLVCAFALIAFGLVALRQSSIGRKLSALKDSPNASATLGMNLVRTKVFIFALSSGIAGLGGALYSAQEIAVNADHFGIIPSLALVLTVVVSGIGYTTGAFTGGIMSGVLFIVLTNVFEKLSEDYSLFEWLFNDIIANFFMFMGISFAAISLARSPGGYLNRSFEGYRLLLTPRGRPFLMYWLIFFAGWYILRTVDVINNWTFILVFIISGFALPVIARNNIEKHEKESMDANLKKSEKV